MIKFDVRNALFEYPDRNPYYIYCPPIKVHSAGIVVMHRLCHMLNTSGYPAFLVIERESLGRLGYPEFPTHSSFVTPELTDELARMHFADGLTPIVVYPDSVSGAPLGGGFCIRYLLNYAGHLGGDRDIAENMVFSYSRKIAATTNSPDQVLNIPVSDPDLFVPPKENVKRVGKCFWAAKYKYFHNEKTGPEVDGAFEITRDNFDSLTKLQLRDLFQRSELFFSYENTALAIEAALCGCPTVFLPNKHFKEIIASEEMGLDGIAWGSSETEIERARATVGRFRDKYIHAVNDVERQVGEFISRSQAGACATPYTRMIKLDHVKKAIGYEVDLPLNWICAFLNWERDLRRYSRKSWPIKIIKWLSVKTGVWRPEIPRQRPSSKHEMKRS